MKKEINYYVSGCMEDEEGEITRVSDESAQFWSMYYRYRDGIEICLKDFKEREKAFQYANELENSDIQKRLLDALYGGYIKSCLKCGSFKVVVYIDENYFSEPMRHTCKECNHEWGDND